MELKRTLLVGVLGLLALNILIAFGAVGVLTRMSPAIQRILSENVRSLEAIETMLAVLAHAPSGQTVAEDSRGAFDRALAAAMTNVTEAEERPVLARIEAAKGAAFEGEVGARGALVEALIELAEVNRAAMKAADREARRQGQAGAWFAVIVTVVSVLLGATIARRLLKKTVEPLDQLFHVLEAVRIGEQHRRCTGAHVPPEFRMIFDSVNRLLDEKQHGQERR